MRAINRIVIHCSATPNGETLFRHGQTPVVQLDAWHRQRGYQRDPAAIKRYNPLLTSIGYHYVIYLSGAVATGRAEEEVGAHARGFNAQSIGICLLGTDRYSDAQWQALSALLGSLQKRFPQATVVGHRDLSPDANGDGTIEPREWLKTCPGFDVAAWLRNGNTPNQRHIVGG